VLVDLALLVQAVMEMDQLQVQVQEKVKHLQVMDQQVQVALAQVKQVLQAMVLLLDLAQVQVKHLLKEDLPQLVVQGLQMLIVMEMVQHLAQVRAKVRPLHLEVQQLQVDQEALQHQHQAMDPLQALVQDLVVHLLGQVLHQANHQVVALNLQEDQVLVPQAMDVQLVVHINVHPLVVVARRHLLFVFL
jgi:hypothetical protein